jgi:asparagine synthase (glutamine-hydrolysing)
MCGIAGVLDLQPGFSDGEHVVASMLDLLGHRGPDDAGMMIDVSCVLGHRRLSIIDLSSAGHQPMASADGRLWITYNGEVYNYVELRAQLEASGRRFRTKTDTEVLLQAYEEWGEAALDRVNGMFAFAIWDRRHRSLFCARDRFGVKPFYYTSSGGRFLFASEIKALFADATVRREPNDDRVFDYLAWNIVDHTPETMFAGIAQLPPGCALQHAPDQAGPTVKRWYTARPARGDDSPAVLGALLESAVEVRLRSDVPVGISLSGGMDSSSILAVATKIERRRDGQVPRSFSARSVVPEVDEYPYSEALLRITGSENVHFVPSEADLRAELDSLLWHLDEPFHGPSAFAHRKVLEVARSHGVIVLLDGAGGDEALSGYHHVHYAPMLLELVRRGRLRQFLAELRARSRLHGVSVGRTTKDLLKLLLPRRLRPRRVPAWILDGRRVPPRPDSGRTLGSHQRFAIDRAPLPLYNRISDRNSMAVSIEARNPFLDYRVVELGLHLPIERLLHRGMTKWSLREAMRDLLPPAIVERVTKQGFSSDERLWFRGALGEELEATFHSESFARRGYFDVARVLELLNRHRHGADHASELWRAFSVERWLRLFVDPQTLSVPERAPHAPAPTPLDPAKVVRFAGDALAART